MKSDVNLRNNAAAHLTRNNLTEEAFSPFYSTAMPDALNLEPECLPCLQLLNISNHFPRVPASSAVLLLSVLDAETESGRVFSQ